MRFTTSFIAYGLMVVVFIFFPGCGEQRDLLNAYQAGKRDLLRAMEEKAQREQETHHAANNLLTETKKDEKNNSSGATRPTTNEEDLDYAMQPFLSVLPYYCNPFRYPAHIVHAARACQPHLKRIYAHGTVDWTALYGGHDPDDYGVRPAP